MSRMIDIDRPVKVRYVDERTGEVIISYHTVAELLSGNVDDVVIEELIEESENE